MCKKLICTISTILAFCILSNASGVTGPRNPKPADGAVNVPLDVVLEWASSGMDWQNIFFGTNRYNVNIAREGSAEHKGMTFPSTYKPEDLQPCTTYYWKIVGLEYLGEFTIEHEGPVWEFATISSDTTGVELTPGSDAVIIEQVDFRGGPNSGVGEITIIRSIANDFSGLISGYINATDSAGQWVVRNLPVLPECAYDMPSITTRFDLGVENGTDVTSIDLYVEYSPEPYVTFAAGPTRKFNVGATIFAAGGVGNDLLNGYLPGPDLSKVIFDPEGIICINHQKGHKNEQAAYNQCAPMAVANSLDWLRTEKGLSVPKKHKHKKGLRSDAPADGDNPNDLSLVGELEKAMDRNVTSRKAGDGVWPMDGKLKYINDNGLKDKLDIKHQGDGATGGNPSEVVDGSKNITRHGVTSHGKGAKVTWKWLCEEIKKGQDVEIDIHFPKPNEGRHYVNVTGCGKIFGKPYITHISDHSQTDVDPNDTEGTDKVDFAWMDDDELDHPDLASWNGQIDQALSESVKPKPADQSRYKRYEGFERYATPWSQCCGELISDTWLDGTKNYTGSIVKVGTAGPGPCQEELDIPVYPLHGGEQSMVVIYQNNSELIVGYYSEVTADTNDIGLGRDWIGAGADGLSLWVHGDASNAPEPMYVVVEDGSGMTEIVYHDDPLVTLTDAWTQWSIPFNEFGNVNLADICSLTIGIGQRGNSTVSGSLGIVFFDDIGLCKAVTACSPGDLNTDSIVNFEDLAILANYWLQESPAPCDPGVIAKEVEDCGPTLEELTPPLTPEGYVYVGYTVVVNSTTTKTTLPPDYTPSPEDIVYISSHTVVRNEVTVCDVTVLHTFRKE